MKIWERSFTIFIFFIFVLVITVQAGFAQGIWSSYLSPWSPMWVGSRFYTSFNPLLSPFLFQPDFHPPLYLNSGWSNSIQPISAPTQILPVPYQRVPNATIIFTSPTLTAITASPGVILIGGTNVLVPQTVLASTVASSSVVASLPAPATIANPAPAPLFSLLAVLYASALLDGNALLSTANPLLFAYLTTLLF